MTNEKMEKAIELLNSALYTADDLTKSELLRLKALFATELNISLCKRGKFNIYDFAEKKDKLRPAYFGVFHDAENEVAVATDGYILVYSKVAYNPEFAGKIIGPDGAEIEGRFPKWKNVLPNFTGLATVNVNFSTEQVAEAEKEYKLLSKEEQKKSHARIDCTETIGTYCSTGLSGQKVYGIGLATRHLKLLLKNGITSVEAARNKPYAVKAHCDEFDAILMPLCI